MFRVFRGRLVGTFAHEKLESPENLVGLRRPFTKKSVSYVSCISWALGGDVCPRKTRKSRKFSRPPAPLHEEICFVCFVYFVGAWWGRLPTKNSKVPKI